MREDTASASPGSRDAWVHASMGSIRSRRRREPMEKASGPLLRYFSFRMPKGFLGDCPSSGCPTKPTPRIRVPTARACEDLAYSRAKAVRNKKISRTGNLGRQEAGCRRSVRADGCAMSETCRDCSERETGDRAAARSPDRFPGPFVVFPGGAGIPSQIGIPNHGFGPPACSVGVRAPDLGQPRYEVLLSSWLRSRTSSSGLMGLWNQRSTPPGPQARPYSSGRWPVTAKIFRPA